MLSEIATHVYIIRSYNATLRYHPRSTLGGRVVTKEKKGRKKRRKEARKSKKRRAVKLIRKERRTKEK
jgi:hypothetical protein